MENIKPILAITMGDPAGIGPEIVAKALMRESVYAECKPLVVGNAEVMRKAIELLGLPLKVRQIADVSEASFARGTIDIIQIEGEHGKVRYGEVSAEAGDMAFEAIRTAIDLAMQNKVDGTVTAPINKEAINLAGHHFSGHTEIYAHFTNTKKYGMLLADEHLRVIHVSTHVSLRQACDLVVKERIMEVTRLLRDACIQFGIDAPRIGIAGLNPHSGDGGLFGWEEEREIIPAIESLKAEGINVEGPVPADTMFSKAIGGRYDGCVAMYHDQGHIPFKVVGFQWDKESGKMSSVKGVNITLGLPIIRVSVDHGTAFDVAGRGIASEDAMLISIDYASRMAVSRMKNRK